MTNNNQLLSLHNKCERPLFVICCVASAISFTCSFARAGFNAWSRRFPEVSFMTSPRSDLHNGTCSLHHKCPTSLCYGQTDIFLQRFCFLWLYMQRKKRVQNFTCHFPPQLSVCVLKVKVNLQGTLKKTYREKNGVSEFGCLTSHLTILCDDT